MPNPVTLILLAILRRLGVLRPAMAVLRLPREAADGLIEDLDVLCPPARR